MPLQALIKVTDTKTNDVFSTFTYFIAVSFPSSQNHFSLFFFQKSRLYLLFYFIYLYLSMMGFFFSCFSFSLFSQSAFYLRLATSSSGCKPLVFWRTSHKCVCVVSVLAELCEARALDGCFTDT